MRNVKLLISILLMAITIISCDSKNQPIENAEISSTKIEEIIEAILAEDNIVLEEVIASIIAEITLEEPVITETRVDPPVVTPVVTPQPVVTPPPVMIPPPVVTPPPVTSTPVVVQPPPVVNIVPEPPVEVVPVPEPVVTTPAPVIVEEIVEVIDDFSQDMITVEFFATTMEEITQFVENLNQIIRNRNFQAWRAYLSSDYLGYISSADHLRQLSELPAMRTRNIVLRTVEDYFIHVVVPSRANLRVGNIEFVDMNRVKAFDDRGLRLYDLEKINNSWTIIN